MSKKIITLLATVIMTVGLTILLISNTGCSTFGSGGIVSVNPTNGLLIVAGNVIDTNEVYNGIKIATQLGVNQAIRSDTNAVQYFQGVDLAIGVLLNNGSFNPAELTNTLNNVNISQLKNPNTISFMEAGVSLYEDFYGNLIANKVQNAYIYLPPALNGLQQGIEAALQENGATP